MTGMSSRLPSGTAIARAMASLLPPGENGTTILSDFGSVTCAVATGVSAIVAKTHRAVREISVRMEHVPARLSTRQSYPVRGTQVEPRGSAMIARRCQEKLKAMNSLRIICPNGHLGFAPLRNESFRLGVAARPDYIAADSGSDDVGPIPLGTDTSTSPLAWQTQDLEYMLAASRPLDGPMLIGSSGDTGANSRVDLYVRIIRD